MEVQDIGGARHASKPCRPIELSVRFVLTCRVTLLACDDDKRSQCLLRKLACDHSRYDTIIISVKRRFVATVPSTLQQLLSSFAKHIQKSEVQVSWQDKLPVSVNKECKGNPRYHCCSLQTKSQHRYRRYSLYKRLSPMKQDARY